MTASKIKERIAECATLFAFEYAGLEGNVDPYYIPESKKHEYLLFYNGAEKSVSDIDSVMNTPFIDGKSLNELADKITITEW